MTDTKNALDLGHMVVTVKVGTGDEAEIFTLHKNLLYKRSEFFGACLSGEWKESAAMEVDLPEDDPAIFQLYVQSLYTRSVVRNTDDTSDAQFRHRGRFYVFAQKMLDDDAKNHAIEAIFCLLKHSVLEFTCEACDGLADMVYDIWTVSSEGAPVRRLLVDCFERMAIYARDEEEKADSLKKCLFNCPVEFLVLVVVALLEYNKEAHWKRYDLEDYIHVE